MASRLFISLLAFLFCVQTVVAQDVCWDGTEVDDLHFCPTYCPMPEACPIPALYMQFYKVTKDGEIIFTQEFNSILDILLAEKDDEQTGLKCVPHISVKMYSDPTYENRADSIAQLAGVEIIQKLNEIFDEGVEIDISNFGANDPIILQATPPKFDELNNRIELAVDYKQKIRNQH